MFALRPSFQCHLQHRLRVYLTSNPYASFYPVHKLLRTKIPKPMKILVKINKSELDWKTKSKLSCKSAQGSELVRHERQHRTRQLYYVRPVHLSVCTLCKQPLRFNFPVKALGVFSNIVIAGVEFSSMFVTCLNASSQAAAVVKNTHILLWFEWDPIQFCFCQVSKAKVSTEIEENRPNQQNPKKIKWKGYEPNAKMQEMRNLGIHKNLVDIQEPESKYTWIVPNH